MPIRGVRNALPTKGSAPTGIFSTRGRQKQDGVTGPNQSTLNYAHSGGGEAKGTTGSADSGKRHQKPVKQW